MPKELNEAPIVIRPLAPHEGPIYRGLRLRSLADSPNAFGSTLAQEQDRSEEAWASRLAAASVSGRDYPLVAECDGVACGLLWAKVDANDASLVNLFQVWVAPENRGRGVGAMLLQAAVDWATSLNATALQLGVTCGDTPAKRLYLRAGFQDVGAPTLRHPDSPLLEQNMRLTIVSDAGEVD
jgi:GNAT superfamily N-acetyltransferase